jgi:glycosyltransferase involved in cell wall biosynthesis
MNKSLKVALYSPSASEALGHPLYAQKICPLLSAKAEVVLFTLYDPHYNQILQNLGVELQISRKFKAGYALSDRFSRFGAFAKVIAGFFFMRLSYVLMKEFYQANKDKDVYHLFEFEYLSAFFFFLFRPRLLSRTVLSFHAAGFRWLSGRSIVVNLYKGVLLPLAVAFLIRRSKATSVMGPYQKQDFLESLSLGKASNKVIVTGWGNDDTISEISSAEARRRLGLAENVIYGLFFGVIRRSKGFIELLDYLPQLPDVHLIIAGAPWDIDKEEVGQMIAQHPEKNRIIPHIGFVQEEDIPYYFAASDIVFLTHKGNHLGFSGPLSLAVQSQRPVVSSAVGQIGHFVHEYKVGRVFKTENWDDFVVETKKLIVEIQQNLYPPSVFARALHENSWKTISERIFNAYQ